MRRIISLNSVKAFYLNRDKIIKKLHEAAGEAMLFFPEIKEIRLVGSVARGEHTGLSDIDLFIVMDKGGENALERAKPYYQFFSEKIGLSIDIIAARKGEAGDYGELLRGSILLA
jgi:predicted nucleotidyltransferase